MNFMESKVIRKKNLSLQKNIKRHEIFENCFGDYHGRFNCKL